MHLPRIVILGRPNVGKSTLFNRICGRRRALVGDEPGMTRDRLYAPAEWLGKRFEVVDTGGMIPAEQELIPSEIFRQAQVAIEEAAHLVMVVDAREGVVPLDEELAPSFCAGRASPSRSPSTRSTPASTRRSPASSTAWAIRRYLSALRRTRCWASMTCSTT